MKQYKMSMPYVLDSVDFFRKHGGYSIGMNETQEQGQERSARELAQAELWASHNLTYEWQDDDGYDGDDGDAFGCVVRHSGEVAASLWGITFADHATPGRDPYCRVVEAELASEVLYATQQNDLLLASNPELRALVAYSS